MALKGRGLHYYLTVLFVMISALWLSGCATQKQAITPTPTTAPPTVSTGQLIRFRGHLFSTAGECGYCHTALKAADGSLYSFESDWRSTLMANAGRDPYYLAHVSDEVAQHPDQRSIIEEKCATCHIGMASISAEEAGQTVQIVGQGGLLDPQNPLYPLALDGVSCTLCHQITEKGLGQPESFSGGFVIDRKTASGERAIYGRFTVDPAMATVMKSASGFVPQAANHLSGSELCAVCHNLFTPYFENDGTLSKTLFPEQTPYTEWSISGFANSQTCQDCHMPSAPGEIPIANTGSPARQPFRQHYFVGGNAWMLSLLQQNADLLKASAEPAQFETTRARTIAQLQENTARLQLTTQTKGEVLEVQAQIEVLTGHKFPTSFPSRRAWLHLVVSDAQGKVLFESGAWRPDGSIVGNANDEDATRYEPHYQVINSPDQVQIYEPIIGDPNGNVTTTLLRAKTYLKDNRLLPKGFDKTLAPEEIAVQGQAKEDPDFLGGQDIVYYRISLPETPAYPLTVKAELLYQSIGFRWMNKFTQVNTPEAQAFSKLAANVANEPIVIAQTTSTVR